MMELTSELKRHSIKRLLTFIHNLEQKLSSVNGINEKLHELISTVTHTHQTITKELKTIKNIFKEIQLEEKENRQADTADKKPTQFDSKSGHLSGSDRISSCSPSSYGSSSASSGISSSLQNIDEQLSKNEKSKRSSNVKKHRSSSRNKNKTGRQVTFVINNNHNTGDETIVENEQITLTNTEEQNKSYTDTSAIKENKKTKNEVDNRVFEQPYPLGLIEKITFSESATTVIPTDQSKNSFDKNSDLISGLFNQHRSNVSKKHNIGYKMGNALTSVRIHEIEQNGDYLKLLNVSNSEDYDLSNHFIQQNVACLPTCRFRFPPQTVIKAGQTVTVSICMR
ncbi:unnamed protein product [Didymodactylos carnosus]|uniref:LTD domain-containing protein n=1 Tax=Didymodactylos carnosus TaxID=1234261 RepID=A0A8S2E4Y8_9BILA|nr:unnamed protein product [Didymodactylos carnosus]CAF3833849.1 unnamed protein product [Didymodactylos carnosus]